MGTLSFMVMEIPNIVSYVELKVYSYTWPVIICKITDIPKWENTPVQNKTRRAIIERS